MFHSARVAVVTKSDLATAAGFDRKLAQENLNRVSHHAQIFEVSAKTGDGMKAWLDFLVKQRAKQAGLATIGHAVVLMEAEDPELTLISRIAANPSSR